MPTDPSSTLPQPDSTAVRVALWRALHMKCDALPHIVEDELGLKLAAPEPGWEQRPDMHPMGTRPFRASIVARARYIEDLVSDSLVHGVRQYVLLGAGLDTFAQRRPELASKMRVFELDQPGPQAWKRQRLAETGLGIAPWLYFAPTNFENGNAWWSQLLSAGFDAKAPAIVASTGVSMYLTPDAVAATLRQLAQQLAPGSAFAMTFLVPKELMAPDMRSVFERAEAGARASGTPFLSYFSPQDMVALARDAGFAAAEHVSAATLSQRYFAGRSDGLQPAANSEELLVART